MLMTTGCHYISDNGLSLGGEPVPYVIPTESILQAIIEGRHENQQVMSVFTYKLATDTTIADGAAALEAFWLKWNPAGAFLDKYTDCLSEQVTNIRTRIQWIHPVRYAFRTFQDDTFIAGKVVGAAMPVNTSITLTKRTQLAGRQQVGTLHMPGVPASGIVNGALQGVQLGRYELFQGNLLSPITTIVPAATFTPVLFHKSSPSVAQPLNSIETARFARIMRRRTVGLGS